MRAEIITVGTELLLGQVADTHSQFISQQAASIGIEIFYHLSIGDNCDRLEEALQRARKRSDIIFICGGLGPTLDDITKEAVSKVLDVGLTLLEGSYDDIDYRSKLGLIGAISFENRYGTAPGLAITKEETTFICLPGPPNEMRPMLLESVVPYLLKQASKQPVISSHYFSFCGISEPALERQLHDLIIAQGNPTLAIYLSETGTVLRVTARAESKDEANRLISPLRTKILERVGENCYSESLKNLEEVVIELLHKRKESLSVAESCTGGLLAHLLSTVPGSSGELLGGIVCYTNAIKERVVGVSKETIRKYGAVSEQTARELASLVCAKYESDYALSITGVAGPATSEGKPIGQVFIGLAAHNEIMQVSELSLGRVSRKRVQIQAANHALFMLYKFLNAL